MAFLRRSPQKGRPEWDEIQKVINGNLEFGSSQVPFNGNLNGSWAGTPVTTPGGADTEFALTHNLNRVPEGWILVSIDKAGIVYKSTTAWTTTQIFLKCNVASATIKVYVI